MGCKAERVNWVEHMGAWTLFDDDRYLIARVFHHDLPPGWRIEARGELVDWLWADLDDAKTAAETHVAPPA